MGEGTVVVTTDARGVATVMLNKPEIHNAFDDALIARLTKELRALDDDEDVRIIVLTGRGKSFSAGADLNWMKKMAGFSEKENMADARALADLLFSLAGMSKPTLAVVQGPAYGGGVGLVCACDIAIAAQGAVFALTEVRLGLIPAVISPFVVGAIGARHARRYFITGERFDAQEAARIGLIHEAVTHDSLAARTESYVAALLEGGPVAQTEAKALIQAVNGKATDDALAKDLARRIARVRVSEEGKEGMAAFFDKRKARWQE